MGEDTVMAVGEASYDRHETESDAISFISHNCERWTLLLSFTDEETEDQRREVTCPRLAWLRILPS